MEADVDNQMGLLSDVEGGDSDSEAPKAMKAGAGSVGPKKARGNPAASGGKSEAGPEKKAITATMKENKVLTSLMIKLILSNTPANRDDMQILYDFFLVAAASPIIKTLTHQNEFYAKKVKQKGKGHNLGTPFVWTTAGLLAGLKEVASEA